MQDLNYENFIRSLTFETIDKARFLLQDLKHGNGKAEQVLASQLQERIADYEAETAADLDAAVWG